MAGRIRVGLKNMISEEIKHIKGSKKDLRKFGITVGSALLIICAVLFWFEKSAWLYLLIIGIILILSGLLFPLILKPLNKIWMTLAIILGWIMTRVILIILFYIILTPIGFIAKIFKKDFLDLKINKSTNSYWEKRNSKSAKINYEKQF